LTVPYQNIVENKQKKIRFQNNASEKRTKVLFKENEVFLKFKKYDRLKTNKVQKIQPR
jgi:hypothetical protein